MIEADIYNLAKWLNEEQTGPIDRQALARLLAHVQYPSKATVQEPFGYVFESFSLPECASEFEWVEGFVRYKLVNDERTRNVTPVYTTPSAAPVQDVVPEGVIAAIRNEGLTLVKDLHGYRLMRLGKVEAQATPPAGSKEKNNG